MTTSSDSVPRKVLNVGGGNKKIAIPDRYDGWVHHLLDIDPRGGPDIVCDARLLATLEGGVYDGIYCSHNLEHYFAHDVPKVLRGFRHVLKADGFAEIRVPDLIAVMEAVVSKKLDIADKLYDAKVGPILVRDVIYGWGREIEASGQDFYAHKTGFSVKSLTGELTKAGFNSAIIMRGNYEIHAFAFMSKPTPQRLEELKLSVKKKQGA